MGKTPKDRAAEDAKKDTSISEDDKLDDALDHSFPASDPPSVTDPQQHLGSAKKTGERRPVPDPTKPE